LISVARDLYFSSKLLMVISLVKLVESCGA